MSGKEPLAVDDLISCLYMLTEFVLGSIPWSHLTEKQAIINEKKKVEEWDRVEDEKRNALLINYRNLYEWLRNQPNLLHTIDYEAFYEELLKTPESSALEGAKDQSLFGFSNPLNDVYDHGFAEKKGGGKGKRGKEKGETSRTTSSHHLKDEKGNTESAAKPVSQSKQASSGEKKDRGSDEKHSRESKEAVSGEKVSKKRSLLSGKKSAEKSGTPAKSKEKNPQTPSSRMTGLMTPK
ncbi:hypothetical protein Aduo_008343 [Ancylostoma duodenale]